MAFTSMGRRLSERSLANNILTYVNVPVCCQTYIDTHQYVVDTQGGPGYANFAIEEPALKLVLIENPEAAASLNHLGVEVASSGDVTAAQARLASQGLDTATEENVSCCYAVQDKVWVEDPDGAPWEIYTVLADGETMGRSAVGNEGEVCCAGVSKPGAAAENAQAAEAPSAIGCC